MASEARRAAAGFQDQAAYSSAVLFGQRTPHLTEPEQPPPHGYLRGAASALAAVAVALLAQFRHLLPHALHRLGRAGKPLLSALHTLHSGHVGDYVAWIVMGVAVLGGLVVDAAKGQTPDTRQRESEPER